MYDALRKERATAKTKKEKEKGSDVNGAKSKKKKRGGRGGVQRNNAFAAVISQQTTTNTEKLFSTNVDPNSDSYDDDDNDMN